MAATAIFLQCKPDPPLPCLKPTETVLITPTVKPKLLSRPTRPNRIWPQLPTPCWPPLHSSHTGQFLCPSHPALLLPQAFASGPASPRVLPSAPLLHQPATAPPNSHHRARSFAARSQLKHHLLARPSLTTPLKAVPTPVVITSSSLIALQSSHQHRRGFSCLFTCLLVDDLSPP